MDWRVHPAPAAGIGGDVAVPGDKSIGHRALLFAALCDGACEIHGLSGGEDNARTAAALEALGVTVERRGSSAVVVRGVGLGGLRPSLAPIDCGNSGTSMRLLAGLLAGQPFSSTLMGDEYLTRRPMRRVIEPLRAMGAHAAGREGAKPGEIYPPLSVGGPDGVTLRGIRFEAPVASAQVKSAVLLAGLTASGPTTVREPGPSRDHTERMLANLGAPIRVVAPGVVTVEPDGWNRRLPARAFHVPGDPSSAAFLMAAALVSGGEVLVRGVNVNPTRTGFIDALRAMGARVEERDRREEAGEPVADVFVAASPLTGTTLSGEQVVRAIDEIPVLAVVAARAEGATVVRDAGELRVKESDRLATTVRMLRAFGVEADELPDGLVVRGRPGASLRAADVDSAGDHRIAMSAAVAALAADAPTRVRDVHNVATSFPAFAGLMGTLGATVELIG